MKDIKTVKEEYQKGNFEKRLNLFLECPLLRDEFIQIELYEASAQSMHVSPLVVNESRKRKSVFYPCKRLSRWCHSMIS